MRLVFALLLVIGLVAVACSGDGGNDGPPTVEIVDIQTGVGDAVVAGDEIVVHYIGYLDDGTVFDSSYDRGEAFTFQLGAGNVIPGWDEGIPGMAQGGMRRLIIPPDLAYGDRGFGDVIPPGAELTFEVELIGLSQAACAPPEDSPPVVTGESFTTESGVEVIVIEGGEDIDPIADLDVASVHYTGWVEADGTRFDSSLEQCEPFTFQLGVGRVIKGWDEGVAGMSPGDIRRLIIPSDLAYGDQGSGSIPPGATLIFDVELVGFGRASPTE